MNPLTSYIAPTFVTSMGLCIVSYFIAILGQFKRSKSSVETGEIFAVAYRPIMSSLLFLFGLCVSITQLKGLNGIEFENSIEFGHQMAVISVMLLLCLTLGVPRILGMHKMDLFNTREPTWSRMTESQSITNFSKIFSSKSTLKLENMERWTKIGGIGFLCLVALVGAFTNFHVEINEYDFYNKSNALGKVSYEGAITQESQFASSKFYLNLNFENKTGGSIENEKSQSTLLKIREIFDENKIFTNNYWYFDFLDWVELLDQKSVKLIKKVDANPQKYWDKCEKIENRSNRQADQLNSKDYMFLLSLAIANSKNHQEIFKDKIVQPAAFNSLLSHWVWVNRARVTLSDPFIQNNNIKLPDSARINSDINCKDSLNEFILGSHVILSPIKIPFEVSSFDQEYTLELIDELESVGSEEVEIVVTSHTLKKMRLLELLDFPNIVNSRVFVIAALILLATSVVHMNLKITFFTVSVFRQLMDLPQRLKPFLFLKQIRVSNRKATLNSNVVALFLDFYSLEEFCHLRHF